MEVELLVTEFMHSLNKIRRINCKYSFSTISHKEFFMLDRIDKGGRSLGQSNGIYVSEIAKNLNMSMPAVSRMLKGLEQRGLIERQVDPDNRRNTFVRTTEKGREQKKEVKLFMEDYMKAVMLRMGEDKVREMIRLLDAMGESMILEWEERKDKPIIASMKGEKINVQDI